MKYHDISKDDMLNGDGVRAVLFVAGCTHHCSECHNPITWNKDGGLEFDEAAKEELFKELEKSWVSGVTFSGGDPLAVYNREEVLELMKEVKERFPDKTIWVYTGWTKDELEAQGFWDKLAPNIDVIVEGKFEIQHKSVPYNWAGSTNQRVLRKESNFTINTSDPVYSHMEKLKKIVEADAANFNKDHKEIINLATKIELVAQNLEVSEKSVMDMLSDLKGMTNEIAGLMGKHAFEESCSLAIHAYDEVIKTKEAEVILEQHLMSFKEKELANKGVDLSNDLRSLQADLEEKYEISEEMFENHCKAFLIKSKLHELEVNNEVTHLEEEIAMPDQEYDLDIEDCSC